MRQAVEKLDQVKPIFYSRKNYAIDNQRLATTAKPLGTTFLIFSLDSFSCSGTRRRSSSGTPPK
jgi:hypothetical protein